MTSANFSGAPTPRPPATMTSAFVRSTPLASACLISTNLVFRSPMLTSSFETLPSVDPSKAPVAPGCTVATTRPPPAVTWASSFPLKTRRWKAKPIALGFDVEAVADEAGVEAGGRARGHVPAAGSVGNEHQVGSRSLDGGLDGGVRGLGVVVLEDIRVGDVHRAAAPLRELLGLGIDTLAADEAVNVAAAGAAELLREGGELVARLANLAVLDFCDDENAAHR